MIVNTESKIGNVNKKKKIILLSDGTGNSRAKIWKSNVWRFYKALDLSPGSDQIAFYDDGVGTSSTKVLAALGGVFGFGLARNVRDLYSFLCRTYNDGDEIFIYGFSRGAFTARVVAGFVCSQGIVKYTGDDEALRKTVYTAYKTFRRMAFGDALLKKPLQVLSDIWDRALGRRDRSYDASQNQRYPKSCGCGADDVLVHFMGLWDTVDAYGGPIDELTKAFNRLVWPLQAADRNINDRIGRVCHALALDEQRQSFEPMLINENDQEVYPNIDKERITQVWFAGVHSDIGGGYPDDGLCLVTLKWMMNRCGRSSKYSLKFIPAEQTRLNAGADFTARLNDSRSGPGVFYRYDPRHLDKICRDEKTGWWRSAKKFFGLKCNVTNKVSVKIPKIHHTVLDRIQHGSSTKVPFNIPRLYAVVDSRGDIETIEKPKSGRRAFRWETPKQARAREKCQKVLWNKVWSGRVLYYATLFSIVLFLVPPVWQQLSGVSAVEHMAATHLGTWTGILAKLPGTIQQIVSFIPGAAALDPIFEHYTDLPVAFLVLIGLIVLLLKLGGSQQRALYDQMGLAWGHLRQQNTAQLALPEWRQTLARLHWSDPYQKFRYFLKFLAEALAIIIIGFMVLAFFNRIAFFAIDASGGVCKPTPTNKLPVSATDKPTSFNFWAKETCLATGKKLISGTTYEISIAATVATLSEQERLAELQSGGRKGSDSGTDPVLDQIERWNYWSDATIISDLDGWRQSPWYMPLMVPFRRHLFVGWYEPVARVGNKWFFRSSMIGEKTQLEKISEENFQPCKQDCESGIGPFKLTQRIKFKLKAETNGELFLYLNDGVILNPRWFSVFYDNNLGVAKVTVREIR